MFFPVEPLLTFGLFKHTPLTLSLAVLLETLTEHKQDSLCLSLFCSWIKLAGMEPQFLLPGNQTRCSKCKYESREATRVGEEALKVQVEHRRCRL